MPRGSGFANLTSEQRKENIRKALEAKKNGTGKKIKMTPKRAIRFKCLDCSGGSANEVTLCTVKDCALFPFRKRTKIREEPDIEVGEIENQLPDSKADIEIDEKELNNE